MDNYESLQDEHLIDRFWTVPNIISLLRLALIPVILWALFQRTALHDLWAFILIVVAYSSDFLDGFIARHTGQVSRFGKMIDPVCDKVITVALALGLFILGKLPLAFFLVVMLRDVLITLGSVVALRHSHKLPLPLIWGKLSTLVYGVVIAFYPLFGSPVLEGAPEWLAISVDRLVVYGTWLSASLIIASFIVYTVSYIQNVSSQKKSS